MFIVDETKECIKGNLVYNKKTNEFVSIPNINSDIIFLVGYINIGFDSETNEATEIWGYHHDFNWENTKIGIPKIISGALKLGIEVEPGDSIRIRESSIWKTYFDSQSGWVKFGTDVENTDNIFVEFFTNTVAEIDGQGNLVSLLMKPVFDMIKQ